MGDEDKKDCSVIGEDLVVNGNISCKSDLKIEGRVEGNVSCVSLFVGKTANITGDIMTENVRVEGKVRGIIKSGSVELKDGCTLEGDISSQTLSIDHGAVFTGSVKPAKDSVKPKINEAAE